MKFFGSQRRRFVFALSPISSIAAALVLAVCAAPCLAGTVRQLTDQKATSIGDASIDDAGSSVYVNASTNQLGGNPEYRFQVFRFDAVTGAGQQITSFSKGVSNRAQTVSVSDDGQWIAFVSKDDPVGQNHDASPEVFVMHPNGTGIAQVASDPSVTASGVTAAVLSGSANRVVFVSRANLLGTNPSSRDQLFAVNRDGTGLIQLTNTTNSLDRFSGISISDDGQRIVFGTNANLSGGNADRSYEVYAIQADGTNLRQITSAPSQSNASQHPVISGNGLKIAFETGSGQPNREICSINWDGTGLLFLTSSIGGQKNSPSITDDGQFVFFSALAFDTGKNEIWKVKSDATGLSQLTTSAAGPSLSSPIVSGGGGRVTFAGTIQSSSSAGSGELGVMTGSGTNRLQLMTMMARSIYAPEITRDGTRVVFASDTDPFGTNPDGGSEIFRIQADGTGLVQVTNISSGNASTPSISAGGNIIVFDSNADIAGLNPDGDQDIFRIQADGTGVQRLTYASDSFVPRISAAGSVVVYGTFPPGNIGLVNANGTGQQYVTNGPGLTWKHSVDDTGAWISFAGNLENPSGMSQVYRMRTDGTAPQRLSTDAARGDFMPEISGAGTRIVYLGFANPVGSNPNYYDQLFTYDTATSQTRQVTAGTGEGFAGLPASISGDGNWVVWAATAPWAEPNPSLKLNLYRVPATGGPTERIGAGPYDGAGGTYTSFAGLYKPRTDMTGTRIVFGGTEDPTGENPDYSSELWMVDMSREPEIRVSRTAPTLVSWDYEAGPLRYDVIRGDVANLAAGLPGTVGLGPVACLENDSPDADTRGFEDVVTPPPGHAFFFVFRGSRGLNFGPGSWGRSSAGAERAPGSGVCAP